MLKNIIFDFGNVIMNWNPDEILNHYQLTPSEHDLLKKVIFKSKEWFEIDAGKINEKEATQIFVSNYRIKLSKLWILGHRMLIFMNRFSYLWSN